MNHRPSLRRIVHSISFLLFLGAFLLNPALGQWTPHTLGEGQTTISEDGILRIASMRAGVAWFYRDRPYSIARPYSVEFDARLTESNNHWVGLYSDAFLFLVADWGTEIKHWQPGLPWDISPGLTNFEPGRWYRIRMDARPAKQEFDVFIDDRKVGTARNVTPPHVTHTEQIPGQTAGRDIIWLGDADDLTTPLYRGGAYNRGGAEWRNFRFYQTPPEGERISPAGRVKAPPHASERLSPAADAEVYAYQYRNWNRSNRGKWFNMSAGWNSTGGEKRAYIQFDVSGVPSVDRAILRLWHYATDGEPGGEIGVYRVLENWVEGTDTYHSGRAEQTAYSGELNWVQQPRIAGSPIATFQATRAEEERIEIDITHLVRQWQQGTPNHGLVLKTTLANPSRSDRTSVAYFRTREFADPCDHPSLRLYYDESTSQQPTATAHPNVSGVWRAMDGPCAGTIHEIGQPGDEVVFATAEIRCADGSGGTWEGRNFRWEGPRTLTYDLTHNDGKQERHRVVFDAQGRHGTVHISPSGATVRIRWVGDSIDRPK